MEFDKLTHEIGKIADYLCAERMMLLSHDEIAKNITKSRLHADLVAHQLISEILLFYFPKIPILSEEGNLELFNKRPNLYWLVDPIDGSLSYKDGFDGWVVQLCLVNGHEIIFSIINAPQLKEVYIYQKGKGVKVIGVQPSISSNKGPVLIDNYPSPQGISQYVHDQLECDEYLSCGSLSLKSLRVVFGAADVFVKDVVVRDWDVGPVLPFANYYNIKILDVAGNPFLLEGSYQKNGLIVSNKKFVSQAISLCGEYLNV